MNQPTLARVLPRLGACLVALAVLHATAFAAPERRLNRTSRWLEVRSIRGRVAYLPIALETEQVAQLGDRLVAVGDSLSTAVDSGAQLQFDDGIGSLRVYDNTAIEVSRIETQTDGSKITHITVPQGTVQFQIRRFTHPGSRLRIETPAGIAGVRGTNFGVGVTPDGSNTAVATLSGSVSASAQGKTVIVNGGFYSTIERGQPPTAPLPLGSSNLRVGIRRLEVVDLPDGRVGVQLAGVLHPINSIVFNGTIAPSDRAGLFQSEVIPLQDNRHLTITVRSPVWGSRDYELTLTEDRWILDNPTARPQVILPARGSVIRRE
ncbi:FecR domain-containing protein [Synechococcus sp. PCC 7336]|uniref:FecR family protein n=1 Tax=Synechococcus sp. PCC 7336 TaxID=195250 RepID=UPI000365267F|nr:FecR family protein [Synechococcus sp. PCC 7336]